MQQVSFPFNSIVLIHLTFFLTHFYILKPCPFLPWLGKRDLSVANSAHRKSTIFFPNIVVSFSSLNLLSVATTVTSST